MNRLPPLPTWRIDPSQKLSFTFGHRSLTGVSGDTAATALYGGDVRVFSRSLKYHRPRGFYSMDGESVNCMMRINGLPNVQAERTPLEQGMKIKAQNVYWSTERDLLGVLDKFDWAMPAGFYYYYFHKPAFLWPYFLKRIRRAAGIGRVNTSWTPPPSDELYLNADVCVLGGGPAGMAAALAAADYGLRVVLLEARPWLGGFYDWRTTDYEGATLHERAAEMAARLEAQGTVRVFKRAFINGLWGDNQVTAFQTAGEDNSNLERYIEVRAHSVVVAMGCIERPLIFENNDRPGVMQVGCAHRLARTYGLLPGEKAVFSVGDDLGLEAAADLAGLGLNVMAVADARVEGHNHKLVRSMLSLGIPFLPGWAVSMAEGRKTVSKVTLANVNGPGQKQFECDLVVASAGQTPVAGPLSLAGAKLEYDLQTNFFLPTNLPPRLHASGRMLGYTLPASIEMSGRLAGLAAALDAGAEAMDAHKKTSDDLAQLPGPANNPKLVTAPGIGTGKKSFVCFDEDVTVKHIAESCRQGFDVPELAKRFTATGTGPGQGGIPGHNLPLLISQFHEDKEHVLHPTTVRPPLTPTLLSTYAGPRHDVFKRTPLYRVQERAGAVFRRVGVWKRARYFGQDAAAKEEIAAVRENVGLIDVSTLGKFRIFGPDALQALQRVYVGDMSRIAESKVKYSAMVNDDGCLIDDGVVTRVAENDYYFTTSSARTGMTVEWFRYHTRYEPWVYHLVNLTDALGAINLAGPKARQVLEKLTREDISNDAFPFMGYRELTFAADVKVRVMRLGFVGELSYEIHIPASLTKAVWDELIEAGQEFNIKPFGLEAQNVLRLEKGHVIIGQESEIRTTLNDLGLGFMWHRDKTEAKTVGAPALKYTEKQENRLKLVGVKMDNPAQQPGDGALIVDTEIRGHICTIRHSASLDQTVGLALVDSALTEAGTPLTIFQDGMGDERWTATVVPIPFYDPEGKRLRM